MTGEIYHIYNRGVDKRNIFLDTYDLQRFFQSIQVFNTLKPIGSIYELSFPVEKPAQLGSSTPKRIKRLVDLVAYCLNPNHYHLVLKQTAEHGIKKLMHRLGTGYTNYFNIKYKRTGSLLQGRFKYKHVDSNDYLLHLSVYVNQNHQLGSSTPKLGVGGITKSSWQEYLGKEKTSICQKNLILEQFKNIKEYEKFTEEALELIKEKKQLENESEDKMFTRELNSQVEF